MMVPSRSQPRLDPFSQEAIDRDPNKFGKQAYTLSHNSRFLEYAQASNVEEASKFIAKECNVQALRFIDDTPEAIEKFQALKAKFELTQQENK